MERGKSRKRKNGRKEIAAGIILCFLFFLLLFLLRKRGTGEPETTEPLSTEETTAETVPLWTEPVELPTTEETTEETTEAIPWYSYTDKSGEEREYQPDPEALSREIAFGTPVIDENGNPQFPKPEEGSPEYEMVRGLDVSKEQGKIDWYQVRESRCDFVFICADERFAENYDGAYRTGLQIGVYAYSSADSPEAAKEEAGELLTLIGDRQIDLFVAYVPEGMETEGPIGESAPEEFLQNTDKERNTAVAAAFCEEIENAGLRPAIYASMLYEAEMYDMSVLSGKYDFWYSEFIYSPMTPYPFSAWQYCLTGGIKGISGPVHLDLYFRKPYEESEEEQKIYSYTQFYEEAYENTTWVNYRSCNEAWNGEWARITAGGQEFMRFGCGICCLSNAVSTLTDRVVMPDEMYYSTKEHTSYYPESGRGAVSWENLRTMSGLYGLSMEVCRKPSDYQKFVEDVTAADTVIILANGDNDRRLWWYTDGHYVGIWKYDPETETVFVTDPSTHYNRLRVKLSDIYNALKTGSNYQYARITRSAETD